MQAGLHLFEVLAESLHDRDGIARNRVVSGPCSDDKHSEYRSNDHAARAAPRHDLLQPFLALPDQLLEFAAWTGAAARWSAPVAVTDCRWHASTSLSSFGL